MRVTASHTREQAGGQKVTFGRGGGPTPVDLILSDHPGLSRAAGEIERVNNGIRITSAQKSRSGLVQVLTPAGSVRAWLSQGATFVCDDPRLRVVIQISGGPTLELHVERDHAPDVHVSDEQRVAADRPPTLSVWSAQAVLEPKRGQEWQTVAAIAAACTRFGPPGGEVEGPWSSSNVPTQLQMKDLCGKWFGTKVSTKWLSDRYDGALVALGMATRGAGDKLVRIVPAVFGGELLPEALLAEVHRRVSEKGPNDGETSAGASPT